MLFKRKFNIKLIGIIMVKNKADLSASFSLNFLSGQLSRAAYCSCRPILKASKHSDRIHDVIFWIRLRIGKSTRRSRFLVLLDP